MPHFGNSLRALRKTRGQTQQALAIAAGISKGYLSKIEASARPPTFSTLQSIAAVLDAEVGDLLDFQTTPARSANLEIHEPGEGSWQQAGEPGGYAFLPLAGRYRQKYLSPFLMEVAPGTTSYFKHDGEEFLHVLDGTVELEYEGRRHTLQAGASAYLDSRIKHRFHNPTRKPAKVLAVNFVYRRF